MHVTQHAFGAKLSVVSRSCFWTCLLSAIKRSASQQAVLRLEEVEHILEPITPLLQDSKYWSLGAELVVDDTRDAGLVRESVRRLWKLASAAHVPCNPLKTPALGNCTHLWDLDRRACEDAALRGDVSESGDAAWREPWAWLVRQCRPIVAPPSDARFGEEEGHAPTMARAWDASIVSAACSRDLPLSYLEVGTLSGLSMTLVGTLLRNRNLLGRLVSVDPYHFDKLNRDTDVSEHELRREATAAIFVAANRSMINRADDVFGYLSLARWMFEVAGLEVEHVRDQSRYALPKLKWTFDIAYVDGWHTELGAWVDIVLCLGLLRPGGILVVDDWHLGFMERLAALLVEVLGAPIVQTYKSLHWAVERRVPMSFPW
eukprot:gnl/TRDRNA2_/TRDRNA2_48060_c0_seq1.p1 gnl/TRDRNA2_/TRDRNA2_48060_c0~~gnl/TRDRNA2_/TRDRNA2_48060_c0_seq1.p1  ORF type:complete len:374 (-),score=34.76 gnl/TRDRNA2_/TRDRNA2_48060_c0_seq1:72-1193(-)